VSGSARSAESSSRNAARASRQHHSWIGIPVCRIGGVRHRGDAAPEPGAHAAMAGTVERDVRSATAGQCTGSLGSGAEVGVGLPYFDTVITYLIIAVTLAFLELSLGKMRLYLWVVIFVGLAIAVAGIGFFISTGSPDKLIPYNQLLATCSLLVLLTVVAVPKLCRKFFVIPDRGVLAVGMLVFGMEALYANVTRLLRYQSSSIFDEPGQPLSALHRRGD